MPGTILRYGVDSRQYVMVFDDYGSASQAAAVLLVHGGFWRAEKGAASLSSVCADLSSRGVVAGSIEYRTVEHGGTWPHCFTDVSQAIDSFCRETGVLPSRTVLAGHSAGGHLALMAAATRCDLGGVIGLAAISDLVSARRENLGDAAVDGLFGGVSSIEPLLLRASPISHSRPACRVLMIHGDADVTVPLAQSRDYCAEMRRQHGCARLIVIPRAAHMHIVKTGADCWPVVRREILRFAWGNLTSKLGQEEGRRRLCQLCPSMPGICGLEGGDGQADGGSDTTEACRC